VCDENGPDSLGPTAKSCHAGEDVAAARIHATVDDDDPLWALHDVRTAQVVPAAHADDVWCDFEDASHVTRIVARAPSRP